MHPHAPSRALVAFVDQAEVSRHRRRRGKPRFMTMMRIMVVMAAMAGTATGVWWLKNESPHPQPVEATRESPLVEARSLRPLLETAQSSEMAAYAMKKESSKPEPVQPVQASVTTQNRNLPVWLAADATKSAELLRKELRERGARQMGAAVRFAMLNVAELLAMDGKTWAAGMATPAASENNASALLLTFYLYHLDRAGDAAGINAFLRAVENNLPQQQAVRDFILAGRRTADFEREMGLAFAGIGVELQFTRRGGAVLEQP